MRKIAVFTGTRAEYGLFRPVLFGLREQCELKLLVSGAHLSKAHGYTLDEIITDGFTPAATIDLQLAQGMPLDVCASVGRAVLGVGEALSRHKPDLLLLLGDRYETLGASIAAQIVGVPVAHLYGGEVTEGAMDEAFRHAITKMSHLHFTSCEAHRLRVLQLGEHPDKVWNVGALGVENVMTLPDIPELTLRAFLGIDADRPYIVCTYHPETLEPGTAKAQLDILLNALADLKGYDIVFTGANADPEGQEINAVHQAYAKAHHKSFHFFPSLGVKRYIAATRRAACVVGNSSSGVVEVPSLHTPVLDIGDRQKGRERSSAVLHCPVEPSALRNALRKVLSPEQRILAKQAANPYQQVATSSTIIQHLLTEDLNGIRKKAFYNIIGSLSNLCE